MEGNQINSSKKRPLHFMQTQELQGRLKSKEDFFKYLDEHRKCHYIQLLTLLQSSSTCRRTTC